MAKPLNGECEVELAGKKYLLRLGLGELEELDNLTGIGTLALARSLASPDAKVSQALAVLTQAMRTDDGKRMPASRVRQISTEAGYFESCSAAAAVLAECLADRSEGNVPAPKGTPAGA